MKFVIGFAFFLTALAAHAQDAPPFELNDEWVAQFSSVDELIAGLPDDLRSRYVLVYSSHSLQAASPLYPRVILFSDRYFLAFHGDSTGVRFDILEAIQFDRDNRNFHFLTVQSDPTTHKLAINHSPQECEKCHTGNLRPNWDPYKEWSGVYGSEDDQLSNDEQTHFYAFVDQAFAHGPNRYQNLLGLKQNDVYPYGNPDEASAVRRPNLALSETVNLENAYQIVRLLELSPLYDKLKNTLLFESLDAAIEGAYPCLDLSNVNELEKTVSSGLREYAKAKQIPIEDADASYVVLFRLFQMDLKTFAPQFQLPSEFRYAGGFLTELQAVSYIASTDLSPTDPELASHLDHEVSEYFEGAAKQTQNYEPALSLAQNLKYTPDREGLCQLLIPRVQKEMANLNSSQIH
jgi:hypothetical protein